MLNWAREQYFAFFCRRHPDNGFINLLEILGYEGFFFQPDGDNLTVPWKGMVLPRVNIVYFTDHAIQHNAQDTMSNELMAQTLRLAEYRGEGIDCVNGLHLAMEYMCASLWCHQRMAQINAAPAPRPFVFPDAYDVNAGVGNMVLYGGARANIPDVAPPGNRRYTERSGPNRRNFLGDVSINNPGYWIAPDLWQYRSLDAMNQFDLSPFYQPLGTNWFLELLGHKPPVFTTLFSYGRVEIQQMFALGFVLINAATTATNISFNYVARTLDEFNRGVGFPNFAASFLQLTRINNFQTEEDCPYIRFIYTTLRHMLGVPAATARMDRSFNNSSIYEAAHGDAYGVYHFLAGNGILRQCRVFSIDNFISAFYRSSKISQIIF